MIVNGNKTNNSAKNTPLPNIGDTVSLAVDKVDRGPSDPPSVLALVMDLDEYGNALLGTKAGKLEQHYALRTKCFYYL